MATRTWTGLVLAVLLCGCFHSEGPLFDETRGACPFETPTSYQEVDKGGSQERFVFETDGAFCKVTNPSGAESRTLFVPIGRNWWIIQDEGSRPTYALMHREGDRLTQFIPRCRDFSAARLRSLGVAFDEDRSQCTADNARQIETLFRAWRSPFRRPSGAYRRADD